MKQSFRVRRLPSKKSRYQKIVIKKIFDEVCNTIYQSRLLPMERVWIDFIWIEKDESRDVLEVSAVGRKLIYDALLKCGVIDVSSMIGFSDRFTTNVKDPHVKIYLDDMQTISSCAKNYTNTRFGD